VRERREEMRICARRGDDLRAFVRRAGLALLDNLEDAQNGKAFGALTAWHRNLELNNTRLYQRFGLGIYERELILVVIKVKERFVPACYA
jgi:hypothetical protein